MNVDVVDLTAYGIKKVARLMNQDMLDRMELVKSRYWQDTEMDISDKELWGQVTLHTNSSDFMTQSNNQAIQSMMQDYVDSGDAEFVEDWLRVRLYRVGNRTAKVYDDEGYEVEVINGKFTEAFEFFYDDIIASLGNYPVLDDDDFYARESEEKNRAFDSEWTYVLRNSIDEIDCADDIWYTELNDAKETVWGWLDGAGVNPLTGHYESIEVHDSSAWVDSDHILQLLEHIGLVTSENVEDNYTHRGHRTVYTAKIPTQEERAQQAASEFQLGLALGVVQ